MSMYENGEKIDVEVARIMDVLSRLTPGSDEYKAVEQAFNAMYTNRIAHGRYEAETTAKMDATEAETKVKEEEAKLKREELAFKREELEHKKAELALATKKAEEELEEAALKRKTDMWLKIGDTALSVAKIVAAVVMNVWGIKTGLKFEETGSLTSTVFREGRKNLLELFKK